MPIFLARFLPVAGRIYVDFLTRNSGRCAAIHVDTCELYHALALMCDDRLKAHTGTRPS